MQRREAGVDNGGDEVVKAAMANTDISIVIKIKYLGLFILTSILSRKYENK